MPPGAPVAAGARLLHRNCRFAAFCATPGWAKEMEWTYEMRREMCVPPYPLHPIRQDVAVSVARVCAAACGVAHALLVPVQIHADSRGALLAVQARGETKGHSIKTVRKRMRSHPSMPPFLSHISLYTSMVVMDFFEMRLCHARVCGAATCLLSCGTRPHSVLRQAPPVLLTSHLLLSLV